MNGSLGRDRVWNDHVWNEIDKAVREEVGRVRVAQKVFPSTVVNNVLPVSANRVFPYGKYSTFPRPVSVKPAAGIDDKFQPFFEISRQFVLTQAQVDGEENVHLAPSLARLAASAIANAEDRILFLGKYALGTLKGVVDVTNQDALPPGFVAEAKNFPPVPPAPPSDAKEAKGGKGDKQSKQDPDILTLVADGIAELNKDAQPGPYALFVSPNRYAQTFAPTQPGFLLTPGDQINRIVTGGFYMVLSLAAPPDIGILVSLGGEPAKIILGTEAMTAFTHIDEKSNYHFRVFERIQMVVRDGRAFQILNFARNNSSSNAGTSQGSNAAGK
jgi:uncharacterized linocin/CFP29 family protein